MPQSFIPMLLSATVTALLAFGCASALPARRAATPPPPTAALAEPAFIPVFRAKDTMTEEFVRHGNWIGQNLRVAPVEKLRGQIENYLGRRLQHRREAHITLLTPPEFEAVSRCLSMTELETLLDPAEIQKASFEAQCVGRVSLGAPPFFQESYFVVVRSPALRSLRRMIEVAAHAKGCAAFKAADYRPHLTIGFDHRDLHEADGAMKDEKSCVFPLKVL